MLEGLTILIVGAIMMGIMTAMAADDKFTAVSGVMFTIFGTTSLFWTAKGTIQYLRDDSSLLWLYKPLADLPEWVGHAGIGATVALWAVAVAFLVDDFAHLPRRKKGGRI